MQGRLRRAKKAPLIPKLMFGRISTVSRNKGAGDFQKEGVATLPGSFQHFV
jgi:hypothetical protein